MAILKLFVLLFALCATSISKGSPLGNGTFNHGFKEGKEMLLDIKEFREHLPHIGNDTNIVMPLVASMHEIDFQNGLEARRRYLESIMAFPHNGQNGTAAPEFHLTPVQRARFRVRRLSFALRVAKVRLAVLELLEEIHKHKSQFSSCSKNEQESLLEKIKAVGKQIVEKVKSAFEGMKSDSTENSAIHSPIFARIGQKVIEDLREAKVCELKEIGASGGLLKDLKERLCQVEKDIIANAENSLSQNAQVVDTPVFDMSFQEYPVRARDDVAGDLKESFGTLDMEKVKQAIEDAKKQASKDYETLKGDVKKAVESKKSEIEETYGPLDKEKIKETIHDYTKQAEKEFEHAKKAAEEASESRKAEIKESIEKRKEKVKEMVEDAKKQAADVKKSVEKAVDAKKGEIKQAVEEHKEKAKQAVEDIKREASKEYEKLKESWEKSPADDKAVKKEAAARPQRTYRAGANKKVRKANRQPLRLKKY